MNEEWISVVEAARMLKVSAAEVRRPIDAGDLDWDEDEEGTWTGSG